jgi:magnesium-protoporphyrin O-methyltransferase
MMATSYLNRRNQIETYFDRTAAATWAKLTSDAPVSRIRATVRKGRDEMRGILLAQLPQDLRGCRLLDAGCGTGALAIEAASRGADVTAIDISPTLVDIALQRAPAFTNGGRIRFLAGDMVDPALGTFDHTVAMDSLIHYRHDDMLVMIEKLAAITNAGLHFTYAPRTTLLAIMHAAGQLFPRGDRSPAIEPISTPKLVASIETSPRLASWFVGRSAAVSQGFYKSNAQELVKR